MSSTYVKTDAPDAAAATDALPPRVSRSPNQRAWARFKRNRLGYFSLLVFVALLGIATFAEVVSNDRPLVARYQGKWFFPILNNQPETRFGGDFKTPTDWHDPFIREQFARDGNWALFTLNPYARQHGQLFRQGAGAGAAERARTGSAPTRRAGTCWRGCSTAFASASGSASR